MKNGSMSGPRLILPSRSRGGESNGTVSVPAGSWTLAAQAWVQHARKEIETAGRGIRECDLPEVALYHKLESRLTDSIPASHMLTFLIGVSGGGKTRRILEDIFKPGDRANAAFMTLSLAGNGGSAAGSKCAEMCRQLTAGQA